MGGSGAVGGAAGTGGASGAGGAGGTSGTTTCGTETCYQGQTCVSGACTFANCAGYQVPGDYATLQAAVTALSTTGGTICLGPQTYDEDVHVGAGAPPAKLTIQGASASHTSVKSIAVEGAVPDVVLKGISAGLVFALTGTQSSYHLGLAMTACKVKSFQAQISAGTVDINLDGVEVTAPSLMKTPALQISASDNGLAGTVVIENSYIHDSGGFKVATNLSFGQQLSLSTTLRNNTFVNNTVAIDGSVPSLDTWNVTSAYYNNLLVDNALAIDLAALPAAAVGNNALHGNTTNYGHAAADGPGYVKSDPKLDSSKPPGLSSGSPCRGAADSSHAPDHDYWGRPRGSSIDIGAVQSSP